MTISGNGSVLAALREQGLDEHGNPVSSYWKAKIEAEEGRVRILELEAQLAARNSHPGSPELRSALAECEQKRRLASHNFQERVREFQHTIQGLRKEVRNLEESRDRWKERAHMMEKVVGELRASPPAGETDVIPLGHTPSIRELLLWFGVRLDEGRSLAVGEGSSGQIAIEVRGDSLARVVSPDKGMSQVFQTVPLSADAKDLSSVFVPYKGFYEYRTDSRVQDVFRMLGRPLTIL